MAYIIGLRGPDGSRVKRSDADLNDNDYIVTPKDSLAELSAKYGEDVQVGDVIPVSERGFEVGDTITDRIKPDKINYDLMRELDNTITDKMILDHVGDMDVADYNAFEEGALMEVLARGRNKILNSLSDRQKLEELQNKEAELLNKYSPVMNRIRSTVFDAFGDSLKQAGEMYNGNKWY